MIHWHAIRNDDGSIDQYAIAGSIDGVDRYTIARVGAVDGTRYEVWEGRHMASSHGTSDEARAHAEMLATSNVRELAHRNDPNTSRQAAERVIASGSRDDHITRVVQAIHRWPGLTSAELSRRIGMERHETARRTADAEHQGRIRKGVARQCTVSGRSAVTWHPPLTAGQQECLWGEVA